MATWSGSASCGLGCKLKTLVRSCPESVNQDGDCTFFPFAKITAKIVFRWIRKALACHVGCWGWTTKFLL